MTIPQISTTIKSRIFPGDTIKVAKRITDDYKFMEWIQVKVLAVYDRFTLTERNGCRECYSNFDILKGLGINHTATDNPLKSLEAKVV